jgi:hypothetical protein
LFAGFHLLLGWSIQRLPSLAPSYRALMHALNLGDVLTIAVLAVAFLACQADLRSRLGRATILLGAFVYLTQALGESVFFPQANRVVLAICVITGALHLAALRAAAART